MNFVLAFIAFNFIVIIHELGHFIAAKKFNIKVLEFSLFVGPKIFSFQRGETVYSLRLFPILAYVKMEGEEESSTSKRAFNNQPRYARAIVAAAAPVANLLVAAIILTIVFSITGFASTRVDEILPGKASYNAGIRKDDRIVSYNHKRVYMPMDILQFLYITKGAPAEVEIIRGGSRLKTTITPEFIPEHKVFMLGIAIDKVTGEDSNVVKAVLPGEAADKAGLKEYDRVVKLNDVEVTSKQDIDAFMKENNESPLKVTVIRDKTPLVLDLEPMVQVIPEQYEIGAYFTTESPNIAGAFKQSIVFTYSIVRNVVYSVIWLITGKASLNQMMGPVGIVSTIGSVVQQSPTFSAQILSLLQMTALFSIVVGATQFIPFPMLDGNRLLLIAIEAIRKKPIPQEKEALISMTGFILLIALAIYAFYNDILRLVGGG